MKKLKQSEYRRAALVFAEGFLSDPAFSLVLQGVAQPKQVLETYFLNYIQKCKELLLYKCEEGEGYLCLYRFDTEFADFELPVPLVELEKFACLEKQYQNNFAVLDILAVAPACRGLGLAGKMVDFFVEYCCRENLTALVEVFSDQHLKLYLSRGFQVTYRRTHKGVTTYILEYKK